MRKLLIPITMIMLVALALTACTGSTAPTANASTPTTGAVTGTASAGTGTPAATGTAVAGTPETTGTTVAGTPETTGTSGTATAGTAAAPTTAAATGTSPAATGTTAATTAGTGQSTGTGTAYPAGTSTAAAIVSTPAAGNTSTAPAASGATATTSAGSVATTAPTTSAAGTTAAGTPAAGATATGGNTGSTGTTTFAQGQLIKLSDILQSSVTGSDQGQIGSVDGLLIERPVLPVENQPVTTPAPTPSGPQQVFLRYILVNVSGASQSGSTAAQNGDQVVIPWQAVTGGGSASNGATGARSLSLNVAASDMAAAPHTTLQDVTGTSTAWMTPLSAYWSGKGVSIPATGANAGSTNGTTNSQANTSLVFIPRQSNGISITDIKGNALGQDSDLLIDAKTGEVMYVVFNAGPTFNNQVVAVPMRLLTWSVGQGAAQITNQGALVLNFSTEVLKNFPSLGNLSNLLTDPNVLNQLNNFWNNIQSSSGTSK